MGPQREVPGDWAISSAYGTIEKFLCARGPGGLTRWLKSHMRNLSSSAKGSELPWPCASYV